MNKSMQLVFVAAVLALGAPALPAAQQPERDEPGDVVRGVALEGSIETTAGAVIFPLTLQGRLQVRDCGGCLHPVVQLDANTQVNLAGQLVSLREMADFATRNPGAALTIHYRLKDLVASRVSVLSK